MDYLVYGLSCLWTILFMDYLVYGLSCLWTEKVNMSNWIM